MNRLSWSVGALAVALAGCGGTDGSDQARGDNAQSAAGVSQNAAGGQAGSGGASAVLRTAQDMAAGTATAGPAQDGVRLVLAVEGLPPGQHGAHVHMTGRCDAPAFESAGGHWNPTDAQHGLENPRGQHAGDMPNLTIGADGRGRLEYTLKGATLEGLMDADGSAMMIHASADDQKTDPSGNSGDRIACGVFEAG